MVEEVRRGLTHAGLACACIAQGTSNAERFHAVERFNDPCGELLVLILAESAASAGLTLTAASHVFLMEPLSSTGDISQAIGRVHRIGQHDRVTIWQYYVRGTVEERLLSSLLRDVGNYSRDFATLSTIHRERGSENIRREESPREESTSFMTFRNMLGMVDIRHCENRAM